MALANLLINLIMAGLLVTTIIYCWVLNRRIKVLQDSKSELAQLLGHFDESTLRASESIIALQTASKKIGENIQTRIDKANYILDDLSSAIERGSKINNALEASMAVSRAKSRVMAEQPKREIEAEDDDFEPIKPAPVLERSNREKTAASLEAVLKRVVGRPASAPEESKQPPRSRSEQELLNMLKAGLKG